MESLTLNDTQPCHHHAAQYRSKGRDLRSPRLPTPDDFRRGSNDPYRAPFENGVPGRDFLPRPIPRDRTASLDTMEGASHFRRDSRNTNAPHSPPYRFPDMRKPSLPPIKTVLGDDLSSPPRTPSPGSPMQLAPREPNYTALTYKPPALYPSKKQCTDHVLNSAPPTSFPGSNSSDPRFAPSSRDNGVRSNVQLPPMETIDTRRANMQTYTAPTSTSTTSPSWGPKYSSAKSPSTRETLEASAHHYRTPEQTPTTAMLEHSFPRVNPFSGPIQDPFTREIRDGFEGPPSRRASASGYVLYPSRQYERESQRCTPYQQGGRHSVSSRESYPEPRESARYGIMEEPQSHGPHSYAPHPYQSGVPAFFMPSHYEYQHGKARKRSNLPKQSTEIMKTWFDQNIGNPYPSEEQKAIFSNATGISMTQVSNWFINHRRRCPELREKREKSRGGSRDCDP